MESPLCPGSFLLVERGSVGRGVPGYIYCSLYRWRALGLVSLKSSVKVVRFLCGFWIFVRKC